MRPVLEGSKTINFGLVGLRSFLIIAALTDCCMAAAQTVSPSRVAPSTVAPLPNTQDGIKLSPVPYPVDTPAESEKLFVTVGAFKIVDGRPDLMEAVRLIVAKIENQRVSVAELYRAAAQIESIYIKKGYLLTRVVIPRQTLSDGGIFSVVVIAGFIEKIDVAGIPAVIRKAVLHRVDRLLGKSNVTQYDIERALLLAADLPGMRIESALARGSQTGGVILVLNGSWNRASLNFSGNNRIGSDFGNVEVSAQGTLNNIFHQGELIYGTIASGPDFNQLFADQPLRRVVGLGTVVPLGTSGWTVNAEYIGVRTTPVRIANVLDTSGVFDRFSVRFGYPIIRRRDAELRFIGAFDAVNEYQQATEFGVRLREDRLRVLSFGLNGLRRLSDRLILTGNLQFTQGLDGFGARSAADVAASMVPYSRLGSRPDFAKIEYGAGIEGQFGRAFTANVRLRGQQSLSGAQPSYGQFSLDSPDALSNFVIGSLNFDSGVTLRSQFGTSFQLRSKETFYNLRPYIFSGFGRGVLSMPTRLERGDVAAGTFGVGLRANISGKKEQPSMEIIFEYGYSAADGIRGTDGAQLTATFRL